MPRASHNRIKPEVSKELEEQVFQLIASLTHKTQIAKFYDTFFTPEEKIMFAKRLMVHVFLIRGYSTAEICSFLSLSKETIRVHSLRLHEAPREYSDLLKKLADRQMNKEFWKKIDEIFSPVELMLNAKSNMKARSKLLSGNND